MTSTPGQLTRRQQLWVELYLQYWDATKATRDAGYATKNPDVTGAKNLRNPLISARIEERLREKAISADEMILRLSQMARTNIADFIEPDGRGGVALNWEKIREHGHLVKSVTTTDTGPVLQLEDRQAAIDKILKASGAYNRLGADAADGDAQRFGIPASAIAPSFYEAYRDINDHRHIEYVFKGGRGSTKSSFTSEVILELLINNPEWHALVARQVKDTLRDSVYSQLNWAINYLGLSSKFRCTTNPLEITYLPTEQKIYFRGGDDPLKIKSIKPRFGYINILWFEELDQFRGAEAVRSIVQSAIRGGDRAYVFKSFNPPKSRNSWVIKDLEYPRDARYLHHSDYTTVPVEWLGRSFIDEAEYLREVNPEAYKHEYMGESTGVGGMVFDNVELRRIMDDEISQFERVYHGLDFGYYPDPAHYTRCCYDAARMTLYIFGEVRLNKASNRQLYDAMVEAGLTPEDTLICDSAEPKSIADLREYGAAARGAEKGPESVRYSMKWLQSLKAIVIDNTRAPATAEEFLNYEHELDRDGNYISDYPDRDNHGIDAVRYATNVIWRRRGQ